MPSDLERALKLAREMYHRRCDIDSECDNRRKAEMICDAAAILRAQAEALEAVLHGDHMFSTGEDAWELHEDLAGSARNYRAAAAELEATDAE